MRGRASGCSHHFLQDEPAAGEARTVQLYNPRRETAQAPGEMLVVDQRDEVNLTKLGPDGPFARHDPAPAKDWGAE